MKTRFTSTGDDDAGDDGDEGGVSEPGLALEGGEVGEEGGEEGGGGADGLVEGDGEVAERDVAADDGGAEDEAESGDLQELRPGFERLERDDLEEDDGEVAEDRAGRHVTHCEEDWEAEAVVGEQELVQEEDSDVRRVPQDHQGRYENGVLRQSHCCLLNQEQQEQEEEARI